MEIKQVDTLDAADGERLFDWGEDIFGAQSLNLRWRPKDFHFLLYNDGKLVSHVGILKHVVKVKDEPIVVGGLGGVVTLPEAQRKGFARRLVQLSMSFMESEWKVGAGLLFCLPRMVRYYESLGWQVLDSPVVIDQPSGKIASPLVVMVLPFGGVKWPPGSVELESFPW